MVAPILPCDACGSPVEDQDLETGNAITLLGKTYCPACKVGATRSVTLHDLVAQVPPPPKPPGPAPTTLPRRRPLIRPGPSKTPWIVAIALFAAALAAAIAVKAIGGGGTGKIEPAPADLDPAPSLPVSVEEEWNGRARKAYRTVETLAGRSGTAASEVLDAIEKARPACKGTPFEAQLETLRGDVLQKKEETEALKELVPLLDELAKAVAEDKTFARYGELQQRFDRARNLAALSDLSRRDTLQALQSDYAARYEKAAEPFYEEIHEAASALAAERRYADALGHIDRFPANLRLSGSWKSLERLRQDIERQRALQK